MFSTGDTLTVHDLKEAVKKETGIPKNKQIYDGKLGTMTSDDVHLANLLLPNCQGYVFTLLNEELLNNDGPIQVEVTIHDGRSVLLRVEASETVSSVKWALYEALNDPGFVPHILCVSSFFYVLFLSSALFALYSSSLCRLDVIIQTPPNGQSHTSGRKVSVSPGRD